MWVTFTFGIAIADGSPATEAVQWLLLQLQLLQNCTKQTLSSIPLLLMPGFGLVESNLFPPCCAWSAMREYSLREISRCDLPLVLRTMEADHVLTMIPLLLIGIAC